MKQAGEIKVSLLIVIAVLVPLLTGFTFYFTANAAVSNQVERNSTLLESQQRQFESIDKRLDRMDGKLDRLLINNRSNK